MSSNFSLAILEYFDLFQHQHWVIYLFKLPAGSEVIREAILLCLVYLFFSKKRREEQASGVLTKSMSGEGTDIAIKRCVQLRVCLWLQISFFRRLWLFSLKIFLSFCFILVALCGNKISLIDCSLGLNSLIFSPEMVKAFVISPSNLIMLIQ